uniref:Zgc:110339 n=1 Tax=Paramormyrops kingsleyae TaxID=1676925 RepID=A0A3B3RGK8_9TELE
MHGLITMMSGALSECRSVLVTGASRGIGLQIVKSMAKRSEGPAITIATARNPAAAEELQRVAKEYSGVHVVTLDVTNQASIDAAVEKVSPLVGAEGLNCLINNAAIGGSINLETVTAEDLLKTYESNTVAPLMVTKAFLPLLRAAATRGSGVGIHRAAVINMSSSLGSIQLNQGALAHIKYYGYRASKTGRHGQDQALRRTTSVTNLGRLTQTGTKYKRQAKGNEPQVRTIRDEHEVMRWAWHTLGSDGADHDT